MSTIRQSVSLCSSPLMPPPPAGLHLSRRLHGAMSRGLMAASLLLPTGAVHWPPATSCGATGRATSRVSACVALGFGLPGTTCHGSRRLTDRDVLPRIATPCHGFWINYVLTRGFCE